MLCALPLLGRVRARNISYNTLSEVCLPTNEGYKGSNLSVTVWVYFLGSNGL